MQPEEYKSNSNKSKESGEKRVESVVGGGVSVKKQTELTKAKRDFFKSDAKSVGTYILTDILIPAFKKLLLDTVNNALSMALNGTPKGSSSSGTGGAARVSYRDRYGQGAAQPVQVRQSYFNEDVEFEFQADAEVVLQRMNELLEQYHMVSIGDMYDLAGLKAAYTEYKYGWFDLRTAYVARTLSNKYIIKLPPAQPI